MDSKHPLASVTNWAAFFALAQGLLTGFGITVDVETAASITAGIVEAIIAVVVLFGRARADKPIRWSK